MSLPASGATQPSGYLGLSPMPNKLNDMNSSLLAPQLNNLLLGRLNQQYFLENQNAQELFLKHHKSAMAAAAAAAAKVMIASTALPNTNTTNDSANPQQTSSLEKKKASLNKSEDRKKVLAPDLKRKREKSTERVGEVKKAKKQNEDSSKENENAQDEDEK